MFIVDEELLFNHRLNHFGIPVLDDFLIGMPFSGMIEIFGLESSGKSALGYQAILRALQQGGYGVIIDMENTINDCCARLCALWNMTKEDFMGYINRGNLAITINSTIEDAIVEAMKHIESIRGKEYKKDDPPIVVLYDSLGGSSTRQIENKDYGDINIATIARVMPDICRKMNTSIARMRFMWIWLNHQKPDLSAMMSQPGFIQEKPTTTPGGGAVKFHVGMRLQLSKAGKIIRTIKGKRVEEGFWCKVVTKKHKWDRQNQKTIVPFLYDHGFAPYAVAFGYLYNLKMVKDFAVFASGSGKYLANSGEFIEIKDWKSYFSKKESLIAKRIQENTDKIKIGSG